MYDAAMYMDSVNWNKLTPGIKHNRKKQKKLKTNNNVSELKLGMKKVKQMSFYSKGDEFYQIVKISNCKLVLLW